MTADQAELRQCGERLYDQYARPLEAEHTGRFIAISPAGQIVIGDSMREVARCATETFGQGNFLFRIGPRSVGRWR